MNILFAIANGLIRTFGLVWNHGGPIALKQVLVPFFMSTYNVRGMLHGGKPGIRVYRVGYVFGVRLFRCQVTE